MTESNESLETTQKILHDTFLWFINKYAQKGGDVNCEITALMKILHKWQLRWATMMHETYLDTGTAELEDEREEVMQFLIDLLHNEEGFNHDYL